MVRKPTAATTAPPTPAHTPPKPSKVEQFKRLATKRVNRTVHAIRLIANLANTSSYEYTTEQAEKVLTSLAEAVDFVGNAFSKQVAKTKDQIQF